MHTQAKVNDVTRRRNTMNLTRITLNRLRHLGLATLIAGLGAAPITLATTGEQPTAQTHPTAAAIVAAAEKQPTTKPATDQAAKDRAATAAKATAPSRAHERAPTPVAGLTETQMKHAKTIVDTAEQMKLPKRAAVVAVATAMQETNLRNLANTGLPESQQLPNDGTGFDHDSVGLFQQRPASGWGPVDQLMDPQTSARKFYQALAEVPGWENMPVTVAAQTVQGSAFPDAYAKHQDKAETVVNALTK
jgi:cytoskeletal protein RodZ